MNRIQARRLRMKQAQWDWEDRQKREYVVNHSSRPAYRRKAGKAENIAELALWLAIIIVALVVAATN